MLPENNSSPGLLDVFFWIGTGIVGIFFAAKRGYNSLPKRQDAALSVAGAIIDNSALQPLLQRFDTLILRLDTLIESQGTLTEFLSRDVKLREAEAEEEAQQERVDDAVQKAMKKLMRDNPAASMPGRRADPAE